MTEANDTSASGWRSAPTSRGARTFEDAIAGVPDKTPSRLRVAFAGTHPSQFNGYSRVTYELCSRLALDPETELFVFGFQSSGGGAAGQAVQRRLPPNVHVYDAAACEVPADRGFGIGQMAAYLKAVRPDVFVVYNDPIVVGKCASALFGLPEEDRRGVLFVPYLDQIYMHLKPAFVGMLNRCASAVICFTPYWEQVLADQGGTSPTAHLRHGFDPARHFPVPRDLARAYFGMSPDDFVVLNLNRNQPRKRWDVCLKAWAEFVQRRRAASAEAEAEGARPGKTAKLLIATSLNGAWNLMEIYNRELAKRGISPEDGRKHIVMLTAPQAMADSQINILYSAADVGINTADGEGFGLCTFEHAGVGVPQVASRVGGITDFLDDGSAALCDEAYRYYVDESRDHVGGEAQLVDPYDVYNALELYYGDPETASRHGLAARSKIAASPDYSWDRLAERFSDILHEVHNRSPFARLPEKKAEAPEAAAPETAAPETAAPEAAAPEAAAPETAAPEAPGPSECNKEQDKLPGLAKDASAEDQGKGDDISSLRSEISELKQMLLEAMRSKAP
jgi:glycosyltransferase involved in cell wall biosynthesis